METVQNNFPRKAQNIFLSIFLFYLVLGVLFSLAGCNNVNWEETASPEEKARVAKIEEKLRGAERGTLIQIGNKIEQINRLFQKDNTMYFFLDDPNFRWDIKMLRHRVDKVCYQNEPCWIHMSKQRSAQSFW